MEQRRLKGPRRKKCHKKGFGFLQASQKAFQRGSSQKVALLSSTSQGEEIEDSGGHEREVYVCDYDEPLTQQTSHRCQFKKLLRKDNFLSLPVFSSNCYQSVLTTVLQSLLESTCKGEVTLPEGKCNFRSAVSRLPLPFCQKPAFASTLEKSVLWRRQKTGNQVVLHNFICGFLYSVSITEWRVHNLLKSAKKLIKEERGMFRKDMSITLFLGLQLTFSFGIFWQGMVLIFDWLVNSFFTRNLIKYS